MAVSCVCLWFIQVRTVRITARSVRLTRAAPHNYTIVANDTSLHLNYNTTQQGYFSVGDVLQPNVTIIAPQSGAIYNYSFNVTIRANVTDDYNVSVVYANVTAPTGAVTLVSMVRLVNNITFEGNYSDTTLFGAYTVRIIANDTTGNVNASVVSNFSVRDSLQSNVTVITPIANSHFNVSNSVAIRVNATDEVNVSSVYANVTMPNSSVVQVFLIKGNNNVTYENNFTLTVIPGNYYVAFWANDTSNNTNSTVRTNFTVDDRLPPNVTIDQPPAGSTYNRSDNVTIRSNVTDDVNVSVVLANITRPDQTVNLLTMVRIGSTSAYEANFSNTSISGAYIIRIVANDTAGNVNASQNRTFVVDDRLQPNVTIDRPPAGSTYNRSANVTIRANVTDDVNVSVVLVNITSPGSVVDSIVMIRIGSGPVYEANFSNTTIAGTYVVRIIANDTSNNVNASVNTTFSVNDFTPPNVTLLLPLENTTFNVSDVVLVHANVSDGNNVSFVYANITLPNASVRNISMIRLDNNVTYEANFSETAGIGAYSIRIIANDTLNNVNSSVTRGFSVGNAIPPNVTVVSPSAGSIFNISDNVSIRANVTDESNVSTVRVNVTLPNGSVRNITLLPLESTGNVTYEGNFSETIMFGTYSVQFFANDSFGNLNDSVSTNFIVGDSVRPRVIILAPGFRTSFDLFPERHYPR